MFNADAFLRRSKWIERYLNWWGISPLDVEFDTPSFAFWHGFVTGAAMVFPVYLVAIAIYIIDFIKL